MKEIAKLSDEAIERRHKAKKEELHDVYRSIGWRFCPWCGEKIREEEKDGT